MPCLWQIVVDFLPRMPEFASTIFHVGLWWRVLGRCSSSVFLFPVNYCSTKTPHVLTTETGQNTAVLRRHTIKRPEEKHTNIPPEDTTTVTVRDTIIPPQETTAVTVRHTTIPPQETSEKYDFFSWFTQSTDYIIRVII